MGKKKIGRRHLKNLGEAVASKTADGDSEDDDDDEEYVAKRYQMTPLDPLLHIHSPRLWS